MEFEICEPINAGAWDQEHTPRHRQSSRTRRDSASKPRQSALFIPESEECLQQG